MADDATSSAGVMVDYKSTITDRMASVSGVMVDYKSTAPLDRLASLSGFMVDYTPVVESAGPAWQVVG